MIANCTDGPSLAGWCAGIAGDDLEQRRAELLWQYLTSRLQPQAAAEIGRHLESCQDCRSALEAGRLLLASRSVGKVVLAVCPDNEELLQYAERSETLGPWRRLEIRQHLNRCPMCREEASWAVRAVIEPAPAARRSFTWAGWFNWKRATWAGAMAVIALAFALVYPSHFGSRRLARYAQMPDIPYEIMAAEFGAAHPEDLPRFRAATQLISLGEYPEGRQILQELEERHAGDRSVIFFKGYVAARESRWKEATLMCTKAERSSLDGFRCWYLANVALMSGDLNLARKEARHASGHAPYKQLAQHLQAVLN